MEAIYNDPKNPGGLGGVARLAKAAGVSRNEAELFLQGQDTYSVNKERRKKFRRNQIIVTNLRQQFQMDLADLSKYKRENDGVTFLLVVIDCFSRLASVQPLKNKTGPEVAKALQQVFREIGEPDKIQSDKGKEFFNAAVKGLMKKKIINLFTSENADIKCAMAERLIRTLKQKIWRLFRSKVSTRYIDKLQDLVYAYNHSVHSAHGMRPVDVKDTNSLKVFNKLYSEMLTSKAPRYKVGDHVRIAKEKGVFEKGYEYRFQEEIFEVYQVIPQSVPIYKLKDEKSKKVKGKFYEQELSLVKGFIDKSFQIDRYIKERGNKVLVRWLGYDKSFDSWINKSDVVIENA